MQICQDERYKKENKPFSNDASAANDEGRSHNHEKEVQNAIQQHQLNNSGETQLIKVEQQQNLAIEVQRNRKMMKSAK